MAAYTFRSEALYDPITDIVYENATGGKLVDVLDGPALPIFDLNDNPITEITSGPSGQTLQFKANVYRGLIQFGSAAVFVTAEEVADFAVAAQGAIDTANQAVALANQAVALATEALNNGGGGGGLPAGTTLEQIPNGTTRLALTQPERDKIAATPTSFLTLGTTSTSAMAGNTTFTPAQIGAVRSMESAIRLWVRVVSLGQDKPTLAEGAVNGDVLVLDES